MWHDTEKLPVERGRKETPLNQLMNAIKDGDTEKCQDLVQQMKPRMINCKFRLKYEGFDGYSIPPLIWAVIKQRYSIVEVLLAAHADVHRLGYFERDRMLYSFNSLLKAIELNDFKMTELLLKHGAEAQKGISGMKSVEEEGGMIQFLKWIYPVNVSLLNGSVTSRLLLKYSDMGLEYGEQRHTCLCYALSYMKQVTDCRLLKEVVQLGGRLCSGLGDEEGGQKQRVCSCFQELLRAGFSVLINDDGQRTLTGNKMHYICVKLLSYTDYAGEHSLIYRAFKHHAENLATIDLKVTDLRHDSQQLVDCLHWILDYGKTPSSLKHIARVTIRKCLNVVTSEKCKMLSLPVKLIKYISLVDLDSVLITLD